MFSFIAGMVLLIGVPGPSELILIFILLLLFFGAKKLPDLARGLGEGIREFKKASKEISSPDIKHNEDKPDHKNTPSE